MRHDGRRLKYSNKRKERERRVKIGLVILREISVSSNNYYHNFSIVSVFLFHVVDLK